MIDLATPEPATAGGAPISSGASVPAVSIDEASRPTISQTVFDNEASVNDCLSQYFFYTTIYRYKFKTDRLDALYIS